jgi:hypothetical protein
MVVFKKRHPPVTGATIQDQEQKNQHETLPTHEAATPAPSTQVTQVTQQVDKATFGTMRYSDMVAKRKSTLNVTPIKKLVETFELFEQVLDYLPMKEVLLATRVCRAFKTNIENSSLLQAKLFLAPDLTIKKLATSSRRTLLSGVKAEQHIAAAHAEGKKSPETKFYTIHPAMRIYRLSDRYRYMGMVQYALHQAGSRFLERTDQDLTLPIPMAAFAEQPCSSLSKMFVSQPPVKGVAINYISSTNPSFSGAGSKHISLTIRKENGVTFGDILLAAADARGPGYLIKWDPSVSFIEGLVINARARSVAEATGELSWIDDPTRWVDSDDPDRWVSGAGYRKVLQKGGFAFA